MATTARFTNNIGAINSGTDNTDRTRNNQYLEPAYAATIALAPYAAYTLVKPGTLTGALTVTAGVGSAGNPPFIGDILDFLFTPDGTTRVVTFGTGFLPNGTLSVTTAKTANASFMFNGTAWVERGRTVTA
jgi:hypothetical protein